MTTTSILRVHSKLKTLLEEGIRRCRTGERDIGVLMVVLVTNDYRLLRASAIQTKIGLSRRFSRLVKSTIIQ
jgi:hypothetical protein